MNWFYSVWIVFLVLWTPLSSLGLAAGADIAEEKYYATPLLENRLPTPGMRGEDFLRCFRGRIFLRILKSDERHLGYQFKDGVNELGDKALLPAGSDRSKGFHFTTIGNIANFFHGGDHARLIAIPPDAEILTVSKGKYSASKLILGPRVNLDRIYAAARLDGANLSEANLREAYLVEVNLSGANLTGANLVGANLTRAKLKRAKLKNAKLAFAKLQATDLREANLKNADISAFQLQTARLGPSQRLKAFFQHGLGSCIP